MNIPQDINEMILKVRLENKNTIDFKLLVVSQLKRDYHLNEYQAIMCYQEAEKHGVAMESIYHWAVNYAQFTERMIRAIK
jgi:hypothetical protein